MKKLYHVYDLFQATCMSPEPQLKKILTVPNTSCVYYGRIFVPAINYTDRVSVAFVYNVKITCDLIIRYKYTFNGVFTRL